jgi:uncharacterized protein (UPF0333 family)
MESDTMNTKGQISIEYILLIIVLLVFIQSFIQPVFESSINASQDVSLVGQARSGAQKLVNALNFVGASPGDMKQTVDFFLPANSTLSCDSATKVVTFTTLLSAEHDSCTAGLCTKSLPIYDSINLNCDNLGTLSPGETQGKYYSVIVTRSSGVVDVRSLT